MELLPQTRRRVSLETPMTDKHFWGSALRLLESIDRRLEAIERSKLALMKDSAIQRIEGLLVNRVGKERASIPESTGEGMTKEREVRE